MHMLTERTHALHQTDPADLRDLYEALDLKALCTAEEFE